MALENGYNFKVNKKFLEEAKTKKFSIKKNTNEEVKNSLPTNTMPAKSFDDIRKIRIKEIIISGLAEKELVKQYVSDYSKRHCFFAPVYVVKRDNNYFAEGNVAILEAARSLGLETVLCKYGDKKEAENDNKYRQIGTVINFNNEFIGKVISSTEKKVCIMNQNGETRKITLDYHLKNNYIKILNNYEIKEVTESRASEKEKIIEISYDKEIKKARIIQHAEKESIEILIDKDDFKDFYQDLKTIFEKEKNLRTSYYIINNNIIRVLFKGVKGYFDKSRFVFCVQNVNLNKYTPYIKEVKVDGKEVIHKALINVDGKNRDFEIEVPNICRYGSYEIEFFVEVEKYKKSDKIKVNIDFDKNKIEVQKEITKIKQTNSTYNLIDARSFVIRADNYNECFGHNVENIDAVIDVFDGNEIKTIEVQAYYCNTCGVYYLNEREYLRANKCGRLICQILSLNEYKKMKNKMGYSLNPESVLKSYGYSAAQKDQLSEKTRRAILEVIIEKNVLTKKEVIDYLIFFIKYHPHASQAIEKWKSDISYLNGYRKGEPRYIKIDKIIR